MSLTWAPVLLAAMLLCVCQIYALHESRTAAESVETSMTALRGELDLLSMRKVSTSCPEPNVEVRVPSRPAPSRVPMPLPPPRPTPAQIEREEAILEEARSVMDRMWSRGQISVEGIATLRRLEPAAPDALEWMLLRAEIADGINSGRLDIEDPAHVMF